MMVCSQIPGDMVVNAMVVAMAIHWNEKGQSVIHVTSSLQNPLSTSTTLEMMYSYFSSNPQIEKNGRVIKAKRLLLTNRFGSFRTYMFLKYKLPLEVKSLHSIQKNIVLENICWKHVFAVPLRRCALDLINRCCIWWIHWWADLSLGTTISSIGATNISFFWQSYMRHMVSSRPGTFYSVLNYCGLTYCSRHDNSMWTFLLHMFSFACFF